jgi:ADP-ribose pyrophosphatase
VKKKKIYEGTIFNLSVYSGKIEGRKVKREIIEHPGASSMIAFDEKNKLILVKQHRFPHGYVLEIPAGTLEKKEAPIDCAFRELEEETGYKAKKMTPLITYYPSIGFNSEKIYCFVASGLKKITGLKLDDDEILSVVKMDLKKVIRMIKNGEIQDSKTICAIFTYAAKKKLQI